MNTKKSWNHRKPQSTIYFQNMFLYDLKNYSIEKFIRCNSGYIILKH